MTNHLLNHNSKNARLKCLSSSWAEINFTSDANSGQAVAIRFLNSEFHVPDLNPSIQDQSAHEDILQEYSNDKPIEGLSQLINSTSDSIRTWRRRSQSAEMQSWSRIDRNT